MSGSIWTEKSFIKEEIKFGMGGKEFDGILMKPCYSTLWNNFAVIITHGAGGTMNERGLIKLSQALVSHGFLVYRFNCKPPNFKYRVKVYAEFINFVKTESPNLHGCIIGGRSMGGRVAAEVSSINADDKFIYGVACFSYPLHKPKNTQDLRLSHLVNLRVPVFIANGLRDEMCDEKAMESVLDKMTCSKTMQWFPLANHSLNLSTEEFDKLSNLFVKWCEAIFSVELS